MYAVEFEASIENGMIQIPKEYQNITNHFVKLIMMYEEDYTYELEQNRQTIAKQVQEYYDGASTLLDQEQSKAKMQTFMQELKAKYENPQR